MLAILIHGFNVWDPRLSVGKLQPFVSAEGIPSIMLNYGHFGLIDTRFKNDKVAKRLAEVVNNARKDGREVVVVGHSNGCAITHRAAEKYGAKIKRAVYLNPALKANLDPPREISEVHVWHSPDDWPVKLAKLLPAVNARPWGSMGAKGYTGASARVLNFNKQYGFAVSSSSHSDVFDDENLAYFGPLITRTSLWE